MLKTRIIGVLVVRNGVVVQSINFSFYLPLGKPAIAVEYLDKWGIDEIILLDITAMSQKRMPDFDRIKHLAEFFNVPLSVGGGITEIEDIRKLISSGADKVILNTAALENPELISQGVELFGKQCIIVSIDAKKIKQDKYEVYSDSGKNPTGYTPAAFAKKMERYGAGEVFINSIDNNGAKNGYDIQLIKQVMEKVNIPVIACGGVNHPRHFMEAIELNIPAVAAANFFHYTEHSPITVKSYLRSNDNFIRLDSYAQYENYTFDDLGRIEKQGDSKLEKLRFEYIPEEII